MYAKDMYMEDVGHIALKAMDAIEEELKKFDIKLTPTQEVEFYIPIFNKLEDMSNGNYRKEM